MAFDLFDILETHAVGVAADKIALSVGDDSRTYRQLYDRALGLAAGLKRVGLSQGVKVGMMMGNTIEHVESIFAVAALGGIFVPINVLFRGEEAAYICDDSDIKIVIIDEHAQRAAHVVSEAVETVVSVSPCFSGAISYESLITQHQPAVRERSPSDTPAAHYYTSGTTGKPKGAVHTHATMLANATQQILDLGLDRDVVFLGISSLTWAAGLNSVPLGLFMAGGQVVLHSTGGITVESIIGTIERFGVTHSVVAPTMLRKLSLRPDLMSKLSTTRLKIVLSGGEPLFAEVIEKLGRHIPDIGFCQGYGLTEFPTLGCVLMPAEALERAGSIGRATFGTHLAVRGTDGAITTFGQGELLIRSRSTMIGYLNQPDETRRAFRDGWLNTGDLADIDPEGYVTIIGRNKDMLISGGLNIYPAEVERYILEMDGIEEVAVVGIPDEKWGEVPVAVMRRTDTGPSGDEVIARCRTGLATYKVPRWVVEVETDLPRTVSGKLQKGQILHLAETEALRRRQLNSL